jgi:hypothetical protein
MDKEFGKVRKRTKGNGICKDVRAQELCDRTHHHSSAPVEVERTCVCAQRGDRSPCDRSQPECERSHLRVKPKSAAARFWKFLILGFCNSLLHKDSNPTIFRVSRILLESINRPVNIEKTHYFGEELTTFKEQFSGFILFLYFIL